MKNHRTEWTKDDEFQLVDCVILYVERGDSQRKAFKAVANLLGRSVGAVEYRWKQIRKENPDVMESFQGAVADALIDAVNNPKNESASDTVIAEISKGAVKVHRMIKQISNPGDGIKLPEEVVMELVSIEENGDMMNAYSREFLMNGEFDEIMSFIDASPENSRDYYMAIEHGYDVELSIKQKISIIYETLGRIKPNEPGYMMARGMIVMMWNTIEILGANPQVLFGIPFENPS